MIIPTMNVSDMPRALAFYTGVLDFTLDYAWPGSAPAYAILMRDGDELHLSAFGNRPDRQTAIVVVQQGDALFDVLKARGLTPPDRPDSPVHHGPVDQTWGTREFYASDPDGNTVVFQQR